MNDEPAPLAEEPAEIVEEEVAMVELAEMALPLAEVPQTGDASALFAAIAALSVSGLSAMAVTGRKNKNGTK